jgi:PleD family two-component response regulator
MLNAIKSGVAGGSEGTGSGAKALRLHNRAAAHGDQEVQMHPPQKHILWIEDHEDIREVVNFFLEQSGYCVTNAGTSVEALSLAQSGHFDFYLLRSFQPLWAKRK